MKKEKQNKEKLEVKPKTIEEFKELIEKEGYFECWRAYGLTCFVYRYAPYGHWCGYVGVPKSHKLYGLNYTQASKSLTKLLEKRKRQKVNIKEMGLGPLLAMASSIEELKPTLEIVFDVHGGITFSGKPSVIWKVDNKWFFGFDTAHTGDLVCQILEKLSYKEKDFWLKESGYTYKTKEYVIQETNKLARQISEV